MTRSNWPLYLLIAALAVAVCLGFFRLFQLRFQAGDIYPPYSTLRADPLGTKVIHDALRDYSRLDIERNYLELKKITRPAETTVFYAGASGERWQVDDVDQLEKLAWSGARVVVTMLPSDAHDEKAKRTPEKKGPTPKPSASPSGEEEDEKPATLDLRELATRWHFGVEYGTTESPAEKSILAKAQVADVEPQVSWHSTLHFKNLSHGWTSTYRHEDQPVLIERPFGQGSIVLATDSYFLSNEAMKSERAPRLIAHLAGPNSRIVFDESHLGVIEEPGIATLVRKYNLVYFLAAAAVLVGLFVWHSNSSFLPRHADESASTIVAGRNSASGFVNLLRRGIAPGNLISACIEQWKRSAGNPELVARVEPLEQQGRGEPVAVYRAINQIVGEKK